MTQRTKNPTHKRRYLAWVPYLLLSLSPYLVVELLYSALYVHGLIDPPSVWLFEETGRTIHFDPVRGYRLTSTPSSFARITRGQIEYVGTFRGNNEGFADRHDFFPERRENGQLRLAVFGDSFTAAQYLKESWPEVLEDRSRQPGAPLKVELLNFSVDGAGLANWWSVLRNIVDAGHYEVDGLLFAVYPGDLHRAFSISDHRGATQHLFSRLSWNPAEWPRNDEDARALLQPLGGYVVTADQFSRALRGEWHPEPPRPWRPYFLLKSRDVLGLLCRAAIAHLQSLRASITGSANPAADARVPAFSEPKAEDLFRSRQLRMIRDIDDFSRRHSLPVFVAHLPSREGLLRDAPIPPDVRMFSALVHGRLIDGRQAFSALTPTEIRAHFFAYDGHWNQKGSDRFAAFMWQQLLQAHRASDAPTFARSQSTPTGTDSATPSSPAAGSARAD